MSQLTDAMTTLGQQIASLNPAANTAHLAAIDAHLTKLDAQEGVDEATIADNTAGLQAFVAAAKGTSSASGTATPAPTAAPAA